MSQVTPLSNAIQEAGNVLPEVAKLFESILSNQDKRGVEKQTNLRYGEHERHILDVYSPSGKTPESGWPVLIFFHGGGFIRGNKEHRSNIGWFFAQQGYTIIMPNYRLAPQSQWPCGPEDVASVYQWIVEQKQNQDFDTNNIFLMGESAGAAHVAAASLRKEFQPEHWNIKGAILLSGPYNARLEGKARAQFGIDTPDPRNEAYFGSDLSKWDQASTVDHISADPFPLLISYTEWDLIQMQVQACELFARLVSEHDFNPDIQCLNHHNHFSQGYSIGTEDRSLSDRLLAFLNQHKH